MAEPDWNKLWNVKIAGVTYVGVILISCRNCGDRDKNWCDCAKSDWIDEQKERWSQKRQLLD